MNTKETTLAKAVLTRACPSAGYGKNAKITITAKAYQLGGNAHPHFSVTAEIFVPHRHDCEACGCLHDEALKYWPAIAPIVRLHLSNADDGEPMHAEGNGWYDMAGALGGCGEQYHRGNSPLNMPCTPPADKPWKNTEHRNPTPDECLVMLAEHLRIPLEVAAELRMSCRDAFEKGADSVASSPEVTDMGEKLRTKAGSASARAVFKAFVEAQRERWAQEAKDGLALIQSLATRHETLAA